MKQLILHYQLRLDSALRRKKKASDTFLKGVLHGKELVYRSIIKKLKELEA